MSVVYKRNIEEVLAFHAAPTLMGLKCGSLPSLSADEYDPREVSRLFAENCFGERVKIRIISRSKVRDLIYVYDANLLEKTLSDSDVRAFLEEYGYGSGWSAEQCLDRLCERLMLDDFPHEIGIFLGYPLVDVKGFIENCGQHCKYCGIWKVYGDVERAKQLFECYRQCRARLCSELAQGRSLRVCVA